MIVKVDVWLPPAQGAVQFVQLLQLPVQLLGQRVRFLQVVVDLQQQQRQGCRGSSSHNQQWSGTAAVDGAWGGVLTAGRGPAAVAAAETAAEDHSFADMHA